MLPRNLVLRSPSGAFTALSRPSALRLPLSRFPQRCNSTSSTASKGSKLRYPERLLIYHSGTGKTVFLGCLKLTTIFVFAFSCVLVAPAYYYSPEQPTWAAPAVIVGGSIPMLFVARTSAPFVNYVHLRLPIFARRSHDSLMRYVQKLPADAPVAVTTMRFSGWPRVSEMKVSELRPVNSRFGIANLKRTPAETSPEPGRPWWMGGHVKRFYVGGSSEGSRERGVWEAVLQQIKSS